MIVDSHVYCFEPLYLSCGHKSTEEHLKWVQASHASHHQPAWRVRDRAPASATALAPNGRGPLSTLPDVGFRADRDRGRFVWTVDGEDFTKQFLPPNLRDVEFTPHSLIAEMDYAGVDMALIHTNPLLGRDNAYLADCVRAYPQRLRAMASVDEWRIVRDTDAVITELNTAIATHGLHAIKFNLSLAYLGNAGPWDDGPYRPFWETATSLDVPVFFTFRTAAQPSREKPASDHIRGYIAELDILIRWMERYPDVTCSLTHGFPYRVLLNGNRLSLPDEIWKPFSNPNCNLEVCFPVRTGDYFDFPYRELWPAFEQMVERIGAYHLLWGTDMPFQNRTCTYRQSRDWIEKYCTFLGRDDLAMIMGGTAARILNL